MVNGLYFLETHESGQVQQIVVNTTVK